MFARWASIVAIDSIGVEQVLCRDGSEKAVGDSEAAVGA